MLSVLEIRGYQSLRKLALRLDRFVVITGPSSSGKTAVFRALRRLAFNGRDGDSWITRGEKSASVRLSDDTEGWAVQLKRGGKGSGSYEITEYVPVPAGGEAPAARTYTKLNGQVPDDVTRVLGLSELNFAGQFDSPFLLAKSAGDVARVLGSLTNVTLVFEAAREANRRKSRLADRLKDAGAELARLQGETRKFIGMAERRAAAQAAEEALARAAALQARADRLRELGAAWYAAESSLARAGIAVRQVPSLERLDGLCRRRDRLRELLGEQARSRHLAAQQEDLAERAAARAAVLDAEHHRLLAEAGVCPVCNQEIR